MKKKLLVASAIVIALGGSIATATMPTQKQSVKESLKVTTVSSPTPTPEPSEAPVVEEPAAPQVSQSQPVVAPVASTLDELVVEYQWDKLPKGKDGILQITLRQFPQYFTDGERVAAFKYMHDVGLAYARTTQSVITEENTFIMANAYWNQLYNLPPSPNDPDKWVQMGKRVGVDTSRYE